MNVQTRIIVPITKPAVLSSVRARDVVKVMPTVQPASEPKAPLLATWTKTGTAYKPVLQFDEDEDGDTTEDEDWLELYATELGLQDAKSTASEASTTAVKATVKKTRKQRSDKPDSYPAPLENSDDRGPRSATQKYFSDSSENQGPGLYDAMLTHIRAT